MDSKNQENQNQIGDKPREETHTLSIVKEGIQFNCEITKNQRPLLEKQVKNCFDDKVNYIEFTDTDGMTHILSKEQLKKQHISFWKND